MIIRCATTNSGKLREFRQAGSNAGIVVEPVANLSIVEVPDETGETFEANASLKALHYAAFTPDWLFVDDSGLEVDALLGAPGVYSARYAGENATDAANNELLIERLQGHQDRTGRFVCVIALAHAGKLVTTFRGEVEGRIIDAPRGSNGFGYDPLFYYAPFGCTFGEASADRKITVSHRGQALARMFDYLLTTGQVRQ